MNGPAIVPKSALEQRLEARMEDAARKAIDSLARYKFLMFGYWAARWVQCASDLRGDNKRGNPFKPFVDLARQIRSQTCGIQPPLSGTSPAEAG